MYIYFNLNGFIWCMDQSGLYREKEPVAWRYVHYGCTHSVAHWRSICLPMQETLRDTDLIPGSGRSPGGGNGNPLQYSCLEDSTDTGALWAAVHGIAKTQT